MNNKILKKICGILGYKLVDKGLLKNNRIISEHSFLNIKKILSELFEQNKINSIIQIGANDGIRFDDLNEYINKYKIESLLIEPIKTNFEKLKNKYADSNFIKLENSAIVVNNEISFLYKVGNNFLHYYDDHIPGITSFNKNHLLKHGVKNRHIVKETINSISIEELLSKYNIKKLDLLYLDTEGYDGKIVIDFLLNTNLKPIIIFEYIHIDTHLVDSLLLVLNKNNYNFFPLNENIICFPNSKKISISF